MEEVVFEKYKVGFKGLERYKIGFKGLERGRDRSWVQLFY